MISSLEYEKAARVLYRTHLWHSLSTEFRHGKGQVGIHTPPPHLLESMWKKVRVSENFDEDPLYTIWIHIYDMHLANPENVAADCSNRFLFEASVRIPMPDNCVDLTYPVRNVTEAVAIARETWLALNPDFEA